MIPAAAVGLCAVVPEGSLIASVEPEASKTKDGYDVAIPTLSLPASTNIA